jgi:hypothetical protein
MTPQRAGQLELAHLTAVAYLSPCRAKMPGKMSMVHFAGVLRVESEPKMVPWTTWLVCTANALTVLQSYPQG